MKVVIAIATIGNRPRQLELTLDSLCGQCDELMVYNNETRKIDYTDNGKFYFLDLFKEPVYYFSCDDDIIYPPDYVSKTIEAIE